MNLQCPNCNAIASIHTQQFLELTELKCGVCGETTILKNESGWLIKLEFILTESFLTDQKNIPEKKCGNFSSESLVVCNP